MYKRGTSVQIKSSASLLCNNLDVCAAQGKSASESKLSVVHKSVVWIFNPADVLANSKQPSVDGASPYKQVCCKGESSQTQTAILQAKWCVLPQRTLLILASVRGMQMFEEDGSVMVFWQALSPNPTEGLAQYARGVSAIGNNHVCVGTADGNILVFKVPSKGPTVKLQETFDAHQSSICDIAADGETMASSDENGKIIVWKSGESFAKVTEINGFGFPCSSLCVVNGLVIGAYSSGHIRIFKYATGTMLCEVCAHSRLINAIDICKKSGLFEFVFEESITDVQLVGVKFLDEDGSSFGVTGYDSNEVFMFSK
eukprot:gene5118-5767_t